MSASSVSRAAEPSSAAAPSVTVVAPRDPSDRTARRLELATLGYLLAVTAIITLAPFRFLDAPQHGLTAYWNVRDVVLNVAMFVPLGFLFRNARRRTGATHPWWTVALAGGLASGAIEAAQLFTTERFSSLLDVLANGAGAGVGAWLADVAHRRLRVGAGAVTALALELPLTGLAYLLVPLCWVSGLASRSLDDPSRLWLLLPVAAFGGALLGAVQGGYVDAPSRARGAAAMPFGDGARAGMRPLVRPGSGALVAAAAAWFLAGGGPVASPAVGVAGAATAVVVALVARAITRRRAAGRSADRRFELPTLRLVLPLLAAFVAMGTVWPLDGFGAAWRGGAPLFLGATPTMGRVFLVLEQCAAFTVTGYVTAEFHGRDDGRYRDVAARVVVWGAVLALVVETARAVHRDYGASLLMVALATSACTFGGWLYHLQRDHVRALLRGGR